MNKNIRKAIKRLEEYSECSKMNKAEIETGIGDILNDTPEFEDVIFRAGVVAIRKAYMKKHDCSNEAKKRISELIATEEIPYADITMLRQIMDGSDNDKSLAVCSAYAYGKRQGREERNNESAV